MLGMFGVVGFLALDRVPHEEFQRRKAIAARFDQIGDGVMLKDANFLASQGIVGSGLQSFFE